MSVHPLHVLLADDSLSDRMLFKMALHEIPLKVILTTVHDGEQLMDFLDEKSQLPDVLFLDLNMPRKNGYECLTEIKLVKKIKQLPVVIFSTALHRKEAEMLYRNGANLYIQKPNDFNELVKLMEEALNFILEFGSEQPLEKDFVLRYI